MDSLRDFLNRCRWHTQDLHTLDITVVHRGAPGDVRTVGGSRIVDVNAASIVVQDGLSEGEGTALPFHRFVRIERDGACLWDREEGFSEAAMPLGSAPTPAPSADAPTPWTREIRVVLDREPLTIDGSAGEGGGQILRSSLTLSALLGTPFVLENIRAGRRKPGLARQHLTCVHAAAAISGAEVEGAELRSTRLSFSPGPVRAGSYRFDVGSAGSVGLVMQTLALPLAMAKGASEVEVRGGTHAKWAPPMPFLQRAWLPAVRSMGFELRMETLTPGFYPAGGGVARLTIGVADTLSPGAFGTSFVEGASLEPLRLTGIVANLSESVVRRSLTAASHPLDTRSLSMQTRTVRSPGPGCAVWLEAPSRWGANVFSVMGERGKAAEALGDELADQFLAFDSHGVDVDEHLCDQLMLPLLLAGSGEFTTVEPSMHAWTNLAIIEAFTGRRFDVSELDQGRFLLRLPPTLDPLTETTLTA